MAQRVNITGYGTVEFPDEMSRNEIASAIENEIIPSLNPEYSPNLPGTALGRGWSQGVESLTEGYGSAVEGLGKSTGIESLREYGSGVAQESQARQQDLAALQYADPDTLEYLGNLVGSQAPILGAGLVGGAVGALAGPAVGLGAGIGGAAGFALPNLPTFYGWNRERQIEELEKTGLSRSEASEAAGELVAASTAAVQASLDFVLGRFFPGIGKLAGSTVSRAMKAAGLGAAGEVPAEVAQQVLERAQAGLPLDDEEALAEYKDAALAAAVLGMGIGAVGGAAYNPAKIERQKREAENRLIDQQIALQQKAKEENLGQVFTADGIESLVEPEAQPEPPEVKPSLVQPIAKPGLKSTTSLTSPEVAIPFKAKSPEAFAKALRESEHKKQVSEAERAYKKRYGGIVNTFLNKRLEDLGLKGKAKVELMSGFFDDNVEVQDGQIVAVARGYEEKNHNPLETAYSRIVLNTGILNPAMNDKAMAAALADTMNHEVLHLIRRMGGVDEKSWRALSKQVERRKNKRGKTYLDQAMHDYEGRGLSDDALREEAAAEMLREFAANPKNLSPAQQSFFQKVIAFIRKIMTGLDKNGVKTADDFMRAVMSGDIGRKLPEGAQEAAPSAQAGPTRPVSPAGGGAGPSGPIVSHAGAAPAPQATPAPKTARTPLSAAPRVPEVVPAPKAAERPLSEAQKAPEDVKGPLSPDAVRRMDAGFRAEKASEPPKATQSMAEKSTATPAQKTASLREGYAATVGSDRANSIYQLAKSRVSERGWEEGTFHLELQKEMDRIWNEDPSAQNPKSAAGHWSGAYRHSPVGDLIKEATERHRKYSLQKKMGGGDPSPPVAMDSVIGTLAALASGSINPQDVPGAIRRSNGYMLTGSAYDEAARRWAKLNLSHNDAERFVDTLRSFLLSVESMFTNESAFEAYSYDFMEILNDLNAQQEGVQAGYGPTPPGHPDGLYDHKGKAVVIYSPSETGRYQEFKALDWDLSDVEGASLNDVPIRSWGGSPDWMSENEMRGDFDEPGPPISGGKRMAAGAVIMETDGSMWVIKAGSPMADVDFALPKGGVEDGHDFRATAIKEAWEETGLQIRLTDHIADVESENEVTRLYAAKRIGGSPMRYDPRETRSVILSSVTHASSLLRAGGGDIGAKLADQIVALPKKIEPYPHAKIVSLSKYTWEGEKTAGSSAGGIYRENDTGKKVIVKTYLNEDQARTEVLSSLIYRLAGLEVPFQRLVRSDSGNISVASDWIDGRPFEADNQQDIERAREGFALDAWLGNWDVVGAGFDNLIVANDQVVRVDNGGALEFRARGGKKDDIQFGDEVSELITMRDPGVNRTAAEVFGQMTEHEIGSSIDLLRRVDMDAVWKNIEDVNYGTASERRRLFSLLEDRRDYLLQWQALNVNDSIGDSILGRPLDETNETIQLSAVALGSSPEILNLRKRAVSPEEVILFSDGHWRTANKFEYMHIDPMIAPKWSRDAYAAFMADKVGKPNQIVDGKGRFLVLYHGVRDLLRLGTIKRTTLDQTIDAQNQTPNGKVIFASTSREFAAKWAYGSNAPPVDEQSAVIPIIASAQKLWDFRKESHIQDVIDWMSANENIEAESLDTYRATMRIGDWGSIEGSGDTVVNKAIRMLGYDAVTMAEGGAINYALFSPMQIQPLDSSFYPGAAAQKNQKFSMSRRYSRGNPNADPDLPDTNGIDPNIVNALMGADDSTLFGRMTSGGSDWATRFFGRVRRADGTREFWWDAFKRNVINEFQRAFDMDVKLAESAGLGKNINRLNEMGARSAFKMMEVSKQMNGRMQWIAEVGGMAWDPETGELVPDTSVKPLREIFARIGMRFSKEYYTFAILKREQELRRKGRRGLYSNISDAEIARNLENASPLFHSVYADHQAFNNMLVKLAVDTGWVEPGKAAEDFLDASYVPFYRMFEHDFDAMEGLEEGELIGPRVTQFLNDPKGALNKALKNKELEGEGGTDRFGDFYTAMLKNAHSMISTSLKNAALNQMAVNIDMLNEAGINDYGSVIKGKPKFAKGQGKWVMRFKREGKEVNYDIKDPALWGMISAMKPIQRHQFLKVLQGFSNVLRIGVTHTPGFMLANLWRGKVSAFVINGAPLEPFIETFKGFADDLVSSAPDSDSMLIKLKTGIGGYDYGTGDQKFAEAFKRRIRRKGVEALKTHPAGMVWDRLVMLRYRADQLGEASEMAERVALYRKLVNNGMSQGEAAYEAMNLINFGRKGAMRGVAGGLMDYMIAAVPFFNARVQGLWRMAEAQSGERTFGLASGVFARGLAVSLASSLVWYMNEDDERWADETVQRKATSDIFYIGDSTLYMSRAFEVGSMFGSVPVLALDAIKNDRGDDFARGALLMAISTFAFNPIPQAILPALETLSGFNLYTMAPIEGGGVSRLAPADRWDERTSEFAKKISHMTEDALLLKAFGVTGISPMKIDHLTTGYLGSLASWTLAASDSIMGVSGALPTRPSGVFGDPHSLPAVAASLLELNRFVKTDNEKGSRYAQEFYRLKERAEQWNLSLKEAIRRQEFDRIKEIVDDPERRGLVGVNRVISRASSALSKLNTAEKVVRNDPNMSADEKNRKLLEMNAARKRIMRGVVEAVEKVGL